MIPSCKTEQPRQRWPAPAYKAFWAPRITGWPQRRKSHLEMGRKMGISWYISPQESCSHWFFMSRIISIHLRSITKTFGVQNHPALKMVPKLQWFGLSSFSPWWLGNPCEKPMGSGVALANTRDPRPVSQIWMASFTVDLWIFMVINVSSLDFVDSEFTDTLCDGNWPVSG